MSDLESPGGKVRCSQFKVGLMALQVPIAEHGPITAATAVVQFDEELPAHALSTNLRVFKAAEIVFRHRHHLERGDFEIKESRLMQAASEEACRGIPDGMAEGARVWLSAA